LCQNTLLLSPINRKLKGYLDDTLLKGCPIDGCEGKKVEISYAKMLNHLRNNCQLVILECPMQECKAKFLRSEALSHFSNVCTKLEMPCTKGCEMILKVHEFERHECLKALRKKIEVQEQHINSLT
jgi:TRAF-type zinc finger